MSARLIKDNEKMDSSTTTSFIMIILNLLLNFFLRLFMINTHNPLSVDQIIVNILVTIIISFSVFNYWNDYTIIIILNKTFQKNKNTIDNLIRKYDYQLLNNVDNYIEFINNSKVCRKPSLTIKFEKNQILLNGLDSDMRKILNNLLAKSNIIPPMVPPKNAFGFNMMYKLIDNKMVFYSSLSYFIGFWIFIIFNGDIIRTGYIIIILLPIIMYSTLIISKTKCKGVIYNQLKYIHKTE